MIICAYLRMIQKDGRDHLRDLLQVASGGVIFITIQKFTPELRGEPIRWLSVRENILVIADDAYRSQYDLIDGFDRRFRGAVTNAS